MFRLLNKFLFLPVKILIMKKVVIRFICFMLLVLLGIEGFSQTKPAPKSKATTQKTTPKPAESEKEIRVGALPSEQQPSTPTLPPLPEIDTTAAPNDELTKEIKTMLNGSGAMKASVETMKYMIDMQRKNPSQTLPGEFYDRFLQSIESGRIGGLLENAIVKVYREKFTLQEVKEVTAFYASATGKKMAAEQTAISTNSRVAGEKIGGFIALQIVGDMINEGKLK